MDTHQKLSRPIHFQSSPCRRNFCKLSRVQNAQFHQSVRTQRKTLEKNHVTNSQKKKKGNQKYRTHISRADISVHSNVPETMINLANFTGKSPEVELLDRRGLKNSLNTSLTFLSLSLQSPSVINQQGLRRKESPRILDQQVLHSFAGVEILSVILY